VNTCKGVLDCDMLTIDMPISVHILKKPKFRNAHFFAFSEFLKNRTHFTLYFDYENHEVSKCIRERLFTLTGNYTKLTSVYKRLFTLSEHVLTLTGNYTKLTCIHVNGRLRKQAITLS